jgi:hypothetical protein
MYDLPSRRNVHFQQVKGEKHFEIQRLGFKKGGNAPVPIFSFKRLFVCLSTNRDANMNAFFHSAL